MNRLLMPLLLFSITAPVSLRADDAKSPVSRQAVPTGTVDMSEKSRTEELPDDFLSEVSDGSKPAADGTITEEESGDTLDQMMRLKTRLDPLQKTAP